MANEVRAQALAEQRVPRSGDRKRSEREGGEREHLHPLAVPDMPHGQDQARQEQP